MKMLLVSFALVNIATMLCLAESVTFPYCATHECGISAGGIEGIIYSLSLLVNVICILATGYYGLTTAGYYLQWRIQVKKEEIT